MSEELQGIQQTLATTTIKVQDHMDRVHFHLTEATVNSLTWEEFEALELAQDGQVKLYRIRPLLARFMVDEHTVYLKQDVAMSILAKITMDQIPNVVQMFMDALQTSTVPKENGNSSG
jgi:hypothetical protein